MSPRSDRLTDRQRAVARLAAEGMSDRQIADTLELSPHTVRTHLRNIFARLEITSREALDGLFDETDGD